MTLLIGDSMLSSYRRLLCAMLGGCLLVTLSADAQDSQNHSHTPAGALGGVVQSKAHTNSAKTAKYVGKTVVITGASSGFGQGIAQKLAALGANVVLVARDKQKLDATASSCGANALAVVCDVSDADQLTKVAEAAEARFGAVDVWINNAGIGAFGRFDVIPLNDQNRMIAINFNGVINGSHIAVTRFKKRGKGTLINVGSIAGKIPIAYYSTYSATKAGVIAFDNALRAELQADNLHDIHVCTVNPPPCDTPFWTNGANYTGRKMHASPMYKPEIVIDAVVDLVAKPKDEINVGFKNKFAVGAHSLAPAAVEGVAARSVRSGQMEKGPIQPPSPGALYRH